MGSKKYCLEDIGLAVGMEMRVILSRKGNPVGGSKLDRDSVRPLIGKILTISGGKVRTNSSSLSFWEVKGDFNSIMFEPIPDKDLKGALECDPLKGSVEQGSPPNLKPYIENLKKDWQALNQSLGYYHEWLEEKTKRENLEKEREVWLEEKTIELEKERKGYQSKLDFAMDMVESYKKAICSLKTDALCYRKSLITR